MATYSTKIMATAKGVSCLEFYSYVRGYHAYKRVWEPARGEALLVTREATNPLDKHTVAIYKEDIFVGHVLQPGSQTVAVFNSLPSSGYGRASTTSTAELVDSLGVSGNI